MISITTPTASLAYVEMNAQPMVLWDNLLSRATITNATLPTTAPRSRAVNESTADYWTPQGVTDTLRGTVGVAEAADCAMIVAHNLAGTLVKVQRLVAAVWTDTASFTPTSNNPFLMIFPEQTSTGWGFEVAGSKQIGVAFIGKRLVIPGGVVPDYEPIWSAREVNLFPSVSRRGHFMGQRIESSGASLSPSFMPVTHDFALNTMRAFRAHYKQGRPFIFAPAPSVFTEDVAYCWPEGALQTTIQKGGDLCNLSMRLRAYCEAT